MEKIKDFLKQNAGLIIVVLAIIAVWYFFLRKKKIESSYGVKPLLIKQPNMPHDSMDVRI